MATEPKTIKPNGSMDILHLVDFADDQLIIRVSGSNRCLLLGTFEAEPEVGKAQGTWVELTPEMCDRVILTLTNWRRSQRVLGVLHDL